MPAPVVVWFRRDLRIADNPALTAAVASGRPVVPVFVWAPGEEGPWAPGGASRWWLHHSLCSLDRELRGRGSRLIVRSGVTRDVLLAVARATGARAVCWNRRYEPAVVARDAVLAAALREAGLDVQSCNGAVLCEPWEVATKAGLPYQVFTPFWRACCERLPPPVPLAPPKRLAAPARWPEGDAIERFELLSRVDWAAGLRARWEPGERGAADRLHDFVAERIAAYGAARDVPGEPGTSRLSPHLHFGEISPRQVWHAVAARVDVGSRVGLTSSAEAFLREVGWREFAVHLLHHFPHTPERPLRSAFAAFAWRDDASDERAWRQGRTGYPIVDAGMRELWATGWMHNRVRMIAASFLVKHLLLPWQKGAAWFWDTLVDADLASNTLGWQWTAGCGADAAPYFRIFNPTAQGERFDPRGAYVRRWVPELAGLPDSRIHQPWTASAAELRAAGIDLGSEYPRPIVDHAAARLRALAVFEQMRRARPSPSSPERGQR